MIKNNKKGITVTSIVVYVILFFMFTSVTTVISSRFNKNLFEDRGTAINVTAINKLQYNLLESADNSYDVVIEAEDNVATLEFSNGDTYVFDMNKNTVYKNGGNLVGFMTNFAMNVNNNLIVIDITVNKYTSKLQRTIKINVPNMEE